MKQNSKKKINYTKIPNLNRILKPKSIAVFGGKEANNVIEQCKKLRFKGKLWHIHPNPEKYPQNQCFKNINALPNPPDAAFIAVNRNQTIKIVEELQKINAGGAICYASGFRETNKKGENLQQQLLKAAQNMPIIGPNCYGIVNALDGNALWPDQHGLKKKKSGCAIIAQSSNIAINISMQKRGVPIAYLLTAGNQAQIGIFQIAYNIVEDQRIKAIALYIEGTDNIQILENLARHAKKYKKPIVILKAGTSKLGKNAAKSHTAAIAGEDNIINALFKYLGIIRVYSIEEMIETLKVLLVTGPINGNKVGSMSCSGGEAVLIADIVDKTQLEFKKINQIQKQNIKKTLNDIVAIQNPLDYHTFIWNNQTRLYHTFSEMIKCHFDIIILIIDFPRTDVCDDKDWHITLNAFKKALRENKPKAAAILAILPENMPEHIAQKSIENKIIPLCGLQNGIRAIENAHKLAQIWKKNSPKLSHTKYKNGKPYTLNEFEAKKQIKKYNIKIPKGYIVNSPNEAYLQAQKISFPVILKALNIEHKTQVHAVIPNLKNKNDIIKAAKNMKIAKNQFLVEKMCQNILCEIIVGIQRMPPYGNTLTIGSGGIYTEIMQDAITIMLPVKREKIKNTLQNLKISPILMGARGQKKADINSIADTILNFIKYTENMGENLIEAEINPLLIRQGKQKPIAADALIRLVA